MTTPQEPPRVPGPAPVPEDVLLEQGDLVTFPADRTHRYEAVDGAAHLLVIHEYPPRPSVE